MQVLLVGVCWNSYVYSPTVGAWSRTRAGLLAAVLLSPQKFIMISHPLAFLCIALCLRGKQLDRFHSFLGRDTPEHLANGSTLLTLISSGLEAAVLKRWLRGTRPGNSEEVLRTAVFALLDPVSEFHREPFSSFVKQSVHLMREGFFFFSFFFPLLLFCLHSFV